MVQGVQFSSTLCLLMAVAFMVLQNFFSARKSS